MMTYLQTTTVLTSLIAVAALFLPGVQSSPYVINDDRVRSLDITPVLGKGYSIMTNSYQSTCVLVDETTIPSYNYDYSFYTFIGSGTSINVDIASMFSYSFGYPWLRQMVDSDGQENDTGLSKAIIAASMRIERYYASLKEEVSPLSRDATTLLSTGDYVGFFKACGPTYIRSIRRAQEVTAFIIYTSTDIEAAQGFADGLQVAGWKEEGGQNLSESNSLQIVIQGFGLGLSQTGGEALVAKTLEEYNTVMVFAFKQMTVMTGDAIHIGMVYGMEVVPWVNNVAFQIETDLMDEVVEIPIATSLIPRSYKIINPLINTFVEAERDEFRCKNEVNMIDKYGYCCEPGALYNYATSVYELGPFTERICKPTAQLDPAFIKDNLAANGEFVARLDQSVRYKLNQLGKLERCIGAARAIPDRQNYHILKGQDSVPFDGSQAIKFTVYELKMGLDPFHDGAMVRHMAKELDEFLDSFIQPCYAALYGANVGTSPDTDVSFFLAYPWHSHSECTKLSCLGNSMRWDRSDPNGGCVPSMIAGASSPAYKTGDDRKCKKVVRNGELVCQDLTTDLSSHHAKTVKVWRELVAGGRVDFFMDTFCMPSLSGEVLEPEAQHFLRDAHVRAFSDGTEEMPLNVALNKPARQSSTYVVAKGAPSPKASLAVDGKTDGYYTRSPMAITKSELEPWWEVDLQDYFEIRLIRVYNRQDCCSERLANYRVDIYNDDTITYTEQKPDSTPDYETTSTPNVGTMGNRVRITLTGKTTYLQIDEVEVITMTTVSFMRGVILERNQSIYSPNKLYQLVLQNDGNLVVYDVKNGMAQWATGPGVSVTLELKTDGNLVLKDANGAETGNQSYTSGASNYVYLSDEGDFQIKAPGALTSDTHTVEWTTEYRGYFKFKSVHNNYLSVSAGGFVAMRSGTGVPGNYELFEVEKFSGGGNKYVIKSASRSPTTYLSMSDRGSYVPVKSTWNKYSPDALFYIQVLGNDQVAIMSATYNNFFRAERGQEAKINTQTYVGGWERFEMQSQLTGVDTSEDPMLHGVNWSPRHILGLCEGDCDRDSHCGTFEGTQLKCHHRNSGTPPVPGCSGAGRSWSDYCILPAGCTCTGRSEGCCG